MVLSVQISFSPVVKDTYTEKNIHDCDVKKETVTSLVLTWQVGSSSSSRHYAFSFMSVEMRKFTSTVVKAAASPYGTFVQVRKRYPFLKEISKVGG